MAISAPHARLFRSLPLPRGGSLLEIGEANWYGDVCLSQALMGCEDQPWDTYKRANIGRSDVANCKTNLFEFAKAFYRATFAPRRIVSIDMNGTPAALRYDLNRILPHDHGCPEDDIENIHGLPCTCQKFEVVINHGTAEHVFNISQVFSSIHDRCATSGLMVHESPCTGWLDHGFYCLQPTLFYDVAAANNYEIVGVWLEHIETNWTLRLDDRDHVHRLAAAGELPNNAMLFVCFRKLGEQSFRIPTQGYYGGKLSEAGNRAWSERR